MPIDIYIQIIATVGVIISAAIGSLKYRKLNTKNKELLHSNKKIITELSAITVLFNHKFLSLLNDTIEEIFSTTRTTRFLLLFAVNGKESFNTVTVCFERNTHPELSGATKRYIRLEVDDQYKLMLKKAENDGTVAMSTATMTDSMLKDIYSSYNETVNHSMIHFLRRISIDGSNDLLLYCSTATIEEDDFNREEKFTISRSISMMRNEAQNSLSTSPGF